MSSRVSNLSVGSLSTAVNYVKSRQNIHARIRWRLPGRYTRLHLHNDATHEKKFGLALLTFCCLVASAVAQEAPAPRQVSIGFGGKSVDADRKLTIWVCGEKLGLLGGSSCTRTKTVFEQSSFKTRETHWSDHSSVGIPDEERAQELASRIRARSRFAGGLCAFKAKVFRPTEGSGRPALPKS